MYDNYLFSSTNKTIVSEHIFKSGNCSKKIKNGILQKLVEVQGAIDTGVLAKMTGEQKIEISPGKVNVLSLQSMLIKNESLPENYRWVTQTEVTNTYVVGFDDEDEIRFSCGNCSSTGSKRLRIDKISSNGSTKSLWLAGIIQAGIEVYIANRNIPAHQQLNPEVDFKKSIYFSTTPQDYSINRNNLKYYRLSRPLTQGSPLKRNQLIPINLVRTGDMINLKLKHNNLNLTTKATAISSGKINDVVKIRNQRSGRIIQGRVIDYNRVEVEL
jgi:flagella basal body P-ring formation protein FlgA